MKRNQSGFTLIEIAIVLVIIGLLLGGVLKGQELINSAKVKNLATDFKNIPVYIYGYQDKFRALPGDDAQVDTLHLAGISGVVAAASGVDGASPGNGVLEGAWNATAKAETHLFWQHVRMAGLAAGPTDVTTDIHPTNATGGKIGIASGSNTPITGLRGTYIICSDGILGKFVKQLDITMDDGVTNTGSMMAATTVSGGAPIANANIDDASSYLVCMGS
ncbi:MAG TPA: prepilin-type N-terminal cleavage/methylation domain-containing protein [Sideroxyarcus sp.]|nr:prepilin-type N-terminal cleavage/methylation domain-containing protein [Sideroxyarcus sp.]